jgi:hypothetical protein
VGLLLLWQRGDTFGYVEGRCGCSNLCDYCAIQAAHENARMLALDAMEGNAPEIVAIVGTGRPTTDPKPFYGGKREVMRALRKEFGRQVEYAGLCEFTTGKGPRSGGLRRPHWNLAIKGIAASEVDRAREIIVRVWCANVPDAAPKAQYVEVLQDTAAFMRYVAMHFQKESQAPPKGWTGQRFNCSKLYFGTTTRKEARTAAKESLQAEREVWKVQQRAPELDPLTVLEIADELLRLNREKDWTLVTVDPSRAEQLLEERVQRVPRKSARRVPRERSPARL